MDPTRTVAGAAETLAGRGIRYGARNDVPADAVTRGSGTKRQWECLVCAHDWNAPPSSVVGTLSRGCPFCAGQALCKHAEHCARCVSRSVAGQDLAVRGIVYSAGNATPASETAVNSNNARMWSCLVCTHSWITNPGKVTGKGQCGCPFCAGRAMCKASDCCARCVSKSVASVDLGARGIAYSADNTTPASETAVRSGKARAWSCLVCAHDWNTTPNSVLGMGKSGCPYCAGQALCPNIKHCVHCVSKSVASLTEPLGARQIAYSASNTTPASETAVSSGEARMWSCLACAHGWIAASNTVTGKMGCGCPYCAGKILCPDGAHCAHCITNSVAGQDLAARGIVYCVDNATPASETAVSSGEARAWSCLVCAHDWNTAPSHITGKAQSGCPACKHKTEALVLSFLGAYAAARGLAVRAHPRFPWCKAMRELPFDAALERPNGATLAVVETDGAQHFRTLAHHGGTTHNDNRTRDVFKAAKLVEHDISLVRIAQEDVWADRWPIWRAQLTAALDAALASKPSVQYLAADERLYDGHRADLATALVTRVLPAVEDEISDGDEPAAPAACVGRKRKRTPDDSGPARKRHST